MSNHIRTVCPSTHEVIFDQPGTSLDEVTKIAAASKQAFQSWRAVPLQERKSIIIRALDLIDDKKDVLSQELTKQMGRPIRFCGAEIKTARLRADYLLDIAEESLADLPGRPEAGFRRMVKRVPVGPMLIASAWNVSLAAARFFCSSLI